MNGEAEPDKNKERDGDASLSKKHRGSLMPQKKASVPDLKKIGSTEELAYKGKAKDPEVRQMMSRMEEMRQEVVRRLDFINSNLDKIPNEYQIFLRDVERLTGIQQVDRALSAAKELEEKIDAVLGVKRESKILAKKKKKREQKRGNRGKTLGARKKWIPMN
ncbi:MAG: hypothetical protein H7A37_03630 [Chlamydiales bacterium]|nr:hypothetical protein [Chlamydiia bacterium]MCP5507377.1 hypothetical protein [Chlamydiales bacterium]